MCGRTVCTLSPECIKRLCTKKTTRNGEESSISPLWFDDPTGNKYVPLYNLPPTRYSPVLLSGNQPHVSGLEFNRDTVIQPMRWGLVPSWHNNEVEKFKLVMNNARSDGLLEKASFEKPLREGKRCVVLCDGYYEWQATADGKKLPYMIYFSENAEVYRSVKVEDSKDEKVKSETEDSKVECSDFQSEEKAGFVPKKLLTMAGLFDISKSSSSGNVTYSFSIITVDAHEDYQFIHERMPAILTSDEEVDDWLDFERVPLEQAIKLIRPTNQLSYHGVSSMVNNSRQNSVQCVLPFDHSAAQKPKTPTKSAYFMMSWLKRTKNEADAGEARQPSKKQREA